MKAPLLGLLGFVLIAGAQQPTIRVTTRLVEVNVIVRDKHGPVAGLTRDDFTLTDRGRPREIAFFSSHPVRSVGSGVPVEPAAGRSVFTNDPARRGVSPTSATVVLLDGVNTSIVDQIYAKKEFAEFLRQIQPQDRIAVYTFGRTLRVLSDFTSDPRRLAATVARYTGRVDRSPDIAPPELFDTGDARTDAIWNDFLQREAEDEVERRVNLTVEALEAVAKQIGRVPGRKNLIWVTAGFPFARMVQREPRIFAKEVNRAARALNTADIAIYPVDARGLAGMAGLSAASRAAPSGGLSVANPAGQDTMSIIADATGGRAFLNNNDIRGAIRRVMDDSELTYTLAFQPDPAGLDSTFHRIKVKVNRPGVEVRHREGYVAMADPPAGDDTRAAEVWAAIASPLESAGIVFRVEAQEGDPLRVSLIVPAQEIALEETAGVRRGTLDAVYAQRGADGRALDTVSYALRPALDAAGYDEALRKGLGFAREIRRAAGAVELRVVLFDRGSGKVGSVIVPLGGK